MSQNFTSNIEHENQKSKNIMESSMTTDSGFMSSGNLLISEEIDESEYQKNDNIDSSENNFASSSSKIDNSKSNNSDLLMVDSGVICLSEDLSNLSLEQSNLNNLSAKSQNQSSIECNRNSASTTIVQNTNSDLPWKIYYQQDEDGDTHLHMAIIHELPEAVFALIRLAPHPRLLDTPNDDALTPLHLAVAKRQWRFVRWLIIAGARPGPRNLAGDSPLHLAVRLGDLECCKAILYPVDEKERKQLELNYTVPLCTNFNTEQWNHDGQTCVHIAAQLGHIEILRHLICFGANINAREGRQGYTALHYAVQRNDEKLLEFLLNECDKINFNVTTYGGNSALQLGAPIKTSILEILKRLNVPSPYSSEEEFSSDSEDDVSFEELNGHQPQLVNANA